MGIRPFNDLAIEFQHEPQHTPCAAGCCGPKLVVKFRSAPSCQQRNDKANEPGLLARKLASAISPPQVHKILWKELNEEEAFGRWANAAEDALCGFFSAGMTDEALEQTFPASDAVAIDIDIERKSHKRGARVLDSRTPLAGNQKVGQKSTETLARAPGDVDLQSPC